MTAPLYLGHTRGRWYIEQAPGGHPTIWSDGVFIAAVRKIPGASTAQCKANAMLIAAAPDLLAACVEAESMIGGPGWKEASENMRNAIAKATGKEV